MIKMLLVSKRLCRLQRQILSGIIAIVLSLTVFHYTFDKGKTIIQDLSMTNRIIQQRLRENIEQQKGSGCEMPNLDPFSDEIMHFNEHIPNFTCEGFDWVECRKNECRVVEKILRMMKDIVCEYTDIIYVNDMNYFLGESVKVLGDDKYNLNRSDHVKIHCSAKNMNSLGILSEWSGYKAGLRPVSTLPVPPDRQDSYNVMILAFNSVSHNGFIRKMRKTYRYLVEDLKAVVMKSFNIVGEGIPGTLYPMFTGRGEEEYNDIQKEKQNAVKNTNVDDAGLIFHLLKSYGYRTAYFEDMPWVGGTFQDRFDGFKNRPADHHLRPLLMDEAKSENKNRNSGFPAKYCIGAVPYYQMMLNLADEFLQLDGKKFCFTFISDITHDNPNVLSTSDDAVLKFLRSMEMRRVFDDTLVIVMGDHGSRFSGIRDTYQGKLEERLPLMAIILPEKLKTARPDAVSSLIHNSEVLTTPFDIHATLLDLLDLDNMTIKRKIPGSDLPRDMSLLKSIPKSRSCGEAGVMPHWCACIKWYNVSHTDPMYDQVARVLAEYIDSLRSEQRSKCARRTLVSVEWVQRQNAIDDVLKFAYLGLAAKDRHIESTKKAPLRAPDEYYQAKIIMDPGRSVFEGTMIYNTAADYYLITERDISRVSAYGDEPNCISKTHPHLNKYCYCYDKFRNRTDDVSSSMKQFIYK